MLLKHETLKSGYFGKFFSMSQNQHGFMTLRKSDRPKSPMKIDITVKTVSITVNLTNS